MTSRYPFPTGGTGGINFQPFDPNRGQTPESGWYGPGGTGVPGQSGGQDPLVGDWLEETEEGRRAGFFGRFGNLRGNQQAFAQSLYQPTFNRFLGELGRQAQGGFPNLRFQDFLTNDFNAQRELLKMPQSGSRLFGRPSYFFGR